MKKLSTDYLYYIWLIQVFTAPIIISIVLIFILHISSTEGYVILFGILMALTIYNLFSISKMKRIYFIENKFIIRPYFINSEKEIPIKNITDILDNGFSKALTPKRRIFRIQYLDFNNQIVTVSFLSNEVSSANDFKVLLGIE